MFHDSGFNAVKRRPPPAWCRSRRPAARPVTV